MIIEVTPPVTEIDPFPGTQAIPCSAYDDKLNVIFLSGASHGAFPGVIVYSPGAALNMFTHFIPGSGKYIIRPKEAFDIVTD